MRSGQTVRLMAAIGGVPQTINGGSRAPLQLTGAAVSGPPALVVPGSTRPRRLLRSVISRGWLILYHALSRWPTATAGLSCIDLTSVREVATARKPKSTEAQRCFVPPHGRRMR
jgi:hypothetical protein